MLKNTKSLKAWIKLLLLSVRLFSTCPVSWPTPISQVKKAQTVFFPSRPSFFFFFHLLQVYLGFVSQLYVVCRCLFARFWYTFLSFSSQHTLQHTLQEEGSVGSVYLAFKLASTIYIKLERKIAHRLSWLMDIKYALYRSEYIEHFQLYYSCAVSDNVHLVAMDTLTSTLNYLHTASLL